MSGQIDVKLEMEDASSSCRTRAAEESELPLE